MDNIIRKLKNVLSLSHYCSICLESSEEMCHLQTTVILPGLGTMLTIDDILEEIFRIPVSSICFSKYICINCKTSAINSYCFIHNAKETANMYEFYFKQLYSQAEDIFNLNNETGNVLIVLDKFKKKEELKLKCKLNTEDTKGCYVCDCCNRQFETRKRLINHFKYLRNKNNRNSLKCPHCGTNSCKHQRYLNLFNSSKAFNSFANCLDCGYQCDSLRAMIKHVNKEHFHLKSDCNTCGRVFYYRPNFVEHIKRCKSTEKPFKCEKCPARFENKYQARIHKREHAEDNWKCNICSKWFLERLYLKQHFNKHHKFDVYECSVCQEDCGDAVKLHSHLLTHKPGERHKCIVCNLQFKSRLHYLNHVRSKNHLILTKGVKELENRQVLCTICYVKCEDMTAYKIHMKTHNLDEKHKCKLCELVFNTKRQYTMHTRKVGHRRKLDPERHQALKCHYCKFQTYHRNALENHLNCKHLGNVPHKCHVCGRGFPSVGGLQNHTKRHTVMGKFKSTAIEIQICDLCGKQFRSKIAWQKHMRLHTGERPYPCDLCDQAFISASHRTAHKFRQHMERTFRCPICENMFHTICNLRLHIKSTHWKRPDKFDYRQLEGLSEEHYELFRDRRMLD